MATPTHHQIRRQPGPHYVGIAEDAENRVGNILGRRLPGLQIAAYFVIGIQNIPKCREKVFLNPPYHLVVDKGLSRGIEHIHFQPPWLGDEMDIEIGIGFQDFRGVVLGAVGIEDRESAVPK